MIDATAADDESVVGDECHIVSGRPQGPRHDSGFPVERLDEPENLILLCRIHHKMVDDQSETYTVELLQKLKMNHERWVSAALAEDGNTATHLMRLRSGQDILRVVGHSCAYLFEHDEPQSQAEVELLGGFLQEAKEWGELSSDLEADARVEAAYRMSGLLRTLEGAGFCVFGGREVQRLEGDLRAPSAFPVAILRIARATNADIVRVDLSAGVQAGGTQPSKKGPPESEGGDV